MVKFNHNEIEDLFITMVEEDEKSKHEGSISSYNWKPPLIIDGKKIDDIYWDGDNFNLIWYNEHEEPEPLDYYKRELEIKPNRNLFIYLFGGRPKA